MLVVSCKRSQEDRRIKGLHTVSYWGHNTVELTTGQKYRKQPDHLTGMISLWWKLKDSHLWDNMTSKHSLFRGGEIRPVSQWSDIVFILWQELSVGLMMTTLSADSARRALKHEWIDRFLVPHKKHLSGIARMERTNQLLNPGLLRTTFPERATNCFYFGDRGHS